MVTASSEMNVLKNGIYLQNGTIAKNVNKLKSPILKYTAKAVYTADYV